MSSTEMAYALETKHLRVDGKKLKFLLDENFGLPVTEAPWCDILESIGIEIELSTDLPAIDHKVEEHDPDIAYIPIADFHRFFAKGDRYYRGLVIATSKMTGLTNLPSVLVVRKDDPASGFDDLEGTKYGYINKSCSSSYYPPAIQLGELGKTFDRWLDMVPTKPWQGQVDAVIAGTVRATMVPEDTWRTTATNAETTKVIGRYEKATPALIVVRHDLDETVCKRLIEALVAWVPGWDSIYGPFRPFLYADVHAFFHDLDQLPAGM